MDLIPYAPDSRDEIEAFYERAVEPFRTAVEQTEQSVEDAAARSLSFSMKVWVTFLR